MTGRAGQRLSRRAPILASAVAVVLLGAALVPAQHAGAQERPGVAEERPGVAEVRSLVNTGHVGAVLDLQYDEQRDLAFSAGEDGTVRIWDVRGGSLFRALHVTPHSVQMIAVNPVAPQVAVVAADGLRSFSLSVWDWEQERMAYRIRLRDAPLFLRFSSQGTYLAYGESTWQGLKILDAATGDPVRFHPEGFGIVGFAEVSRSEKTIMTYQISGRISYWDLASGELIREVPAAPYLSRIRISRDRRFMIGNTGTEAILLDTFTGTARGRAPVTGDTALDIAPQGDRVAGVPAAGGALSQWVITGDTLALQPAPVAVSAGSAPARFFQALCYGPDGLYLGSSDGDVSEMAESGDLRSIGHNILAGITGLDAAHGLLAAGSTDWIRVFRSDLLAGAATPTFVRSLLFDNPLKTTIGLKFLSDGSLLAWSRDDRPPRLAILELPSPFPDRPGSSTGSSAPGLQFRPLPSGFRAPLVDLFVHGTDLVGIESGGTVRVVDMATGATRFETRVPALFAVAATSPTELVGGRNTSLASAGSLVRINTHTGETVGVAGKNVYTWDLLFDPSGLATRGATLYTIGVDAAGATSFLRYDGPGFEKETVVASDPDEDLDASLALDPDTHAVFATVGRARIVVWDGQSVKSIPTEVSTSRRLLARDGLVLSLNRDLTVAVIDQATGSLIAELSLFSDGEWAAVARGGGYLASPGGDSRVKVFKDDAPVEAREDYRLRIESW